MSLLHQVRAWVGAVARRSRMESEMDAEMRFHVETYADDLVRSGMARAEAVRRARVEFGGVEQKKEECRDARGVTLVENFVQDVKFGGRMLRKNPGFTAVAVLTLALGIGANAAIFAVISAVMLRPLSVQHPEQLVAVGDPTHVHSSSTGTPRIDVFSYPLYREVRDRNEVFSALLASGRMDNTRMVISKGTERVTARLVSENYFETLGAGALIGRTFTAADGRVPSGDPLLVISYEYWNRRFGGNPSVLGQTVRLNSYPFTIIGVMGRAFAGEVVEDRIDVWVPIMMQPQVMPENFLETANTQELLMIGRLKPGMSMEQAQANVDMVVKQALAGPLDAKLSSDDRAAVRDMKAAVQVSPGGRGLSRARARFSGPLWLLLGMVALVLLVACINVANLLLARSAARQREMAVRFAIGAGAGRVIRQMLTESLLLACMGGIAGLLLAKWGASALVTTAGAGNGVQDLLALDWRVLGFTAGVCILAALAFGLGPALQFAVVKPGAALKEGGRDSGGGARGRTGRILLSAQIAVGVSVLMGAGLLVRSLRNLQEADLGYSRAKLVLVRLDAGASGYKQAAMSGLTRELLQRFAALPGVEGVTVSSNGLYSGSESMDTILLDGAVPRDRDKSSGDDQVGPNYFSTIGVPIVQGREISMEDYATGARVAVVNETFAKYYFGDRNPLGHAVGIQDSDHPNAPPFQIIGVAGDVRDHDVRTAALRRMYAPLTSGNFDSGTSVNFEIRSENPGALVNSVRSAVLALNPDLVIDNLKTANDLVGDTLRSEALVARLSTLFGALVLVLVCIGLYGSMAYNVAMRTKEIGLRMALGLPRLAVIGMVARDACLVLGIGVLIGVPLGILGSRVFQAMLFGVGGNDPVSISWAIVALVCVCLAAAIVPARRAMRVEPMVALRYE